MGQPKFSDLILPEFWIIQVWIIEWDICSYGKIFLRESAEELVWNG